jgi:hypothetical protein
MSTSPLSPEDIRAAAEAHRELGPEYSDAVVASFLDKVDREVAARVDARLAGAQRAEAAKRDKRRALLKGVAIGVSGSALAVALVAGLHAGSPVTRSSRAVPAPCPVGASCSFKAGPMPGAPVPRDKPKVNTPKKVTGSA